MTSTDPVSQIEAALFDALASHADLATLVRVGNRHSPHAPRQKSQPADADLPELHLSPHATKYHMNVSSRSSRVVLEYSLAIATRSGATNAAAGLNAIKAAAVAALSLHPDDLNVEGVTAVRLVESVDAAYRPDSRPTRASEPTTRRASRAAWRHDLRAVTGWQTILRIEVERWFDTLVRAQ